TLFIYFMVINQYFKGSSWHENYFSELYQYLTTRSAGLSTLDVRLLTESNQLFMSGLMFNGAPPSSAGGGIRTTSFAIVLIFLITFAGGGKVIKFLKQKLIMVDLLKQ